MCFLRPVSKCMHPRTISWSSWQLLLQEYCTFGLILLYVLSFLCEILLKFFKMSFLWSQICYHICGEIKEQLIVPCNFLSDFDVNTPNLVCQIKNSHYCHILRLISYHYDKKQQFWLHLINWQHDAVSRSTVNQRSCFQAHYIRTTVKYYRWCVFVGLCLMTVQCLMIQMRFSWITQIWHFCTKFPLRCLKTVSAKHRVTSNGNWTHKRHNLWCLPNYANLSCLASLWLSDPYKVMLYWI